MTVHDYECSKCGHVHEEVMEWNIRSCSCPKCKGLSNRIYCKCNGILNTAPNWMKDTLKVVDKEGGPHCQEFLKHPNRQNYKDWMKGEGLRPMDQGEKMVKSVKDTSGIRKKVKENFRESNSITVRG